MGDGGRCSIGGGEGVRGCHHWGNGSEGEIGGMGDGGMGEWRDLDGGWGEMQY